MKKGLLAKVLWVIIAAILVVVVLGALAIGLFGNSVLRVGIETAATKALNVGVTLGDVSLSIFGGRLELSDLMVNNPPGYQHETLLQLGKADIAVNVKSLLGDTVNIKSMTFDEVSLVIEQKGLTNNLQEILDSIPKAKKDKTDKPEKGKNLVIDELEISNVDVSVKLLPVPVPGRAGTVTFKLSPIKMKNLGTDDKLSMAELAVKILAAIAGGVAQQGMDLLPAEMLEPLNSALDEYGKVLIDTGTEVLEKTKDIGTGVLEGGKDIGKEATDVLKELLKSKED